MSLVVSNPSFLSDDFTTHMCLTTGKFFYYSELGKYLSMLPPDIIEGLAKSIWKFIYSNKVLEIEHPFRLDLHNDGIYSHSHHLVLEDIENEKSDLQNHIDRLEARPFHSPHTLEEIAESKKRMTKLDNYTLQDVIAIQNEGQHDWLRSQGLDPSEEYNYYMTEVANSRKNRQAFVCQKTDFNIRERRNVCMCFNKDGSMCGAHAGSFIQIAEETARRFQPLVGSLNLQSESFGRYGKWMILKCCNKHAKEGEDDVYLGSSNGYRRWYDDRLEAYCNSWGYSDSGHEGYFCKHDGRITRDTRTKKHKIVKGELVDIVVSTPQRDKHPGYSRRYLNQMNKLNEWHGNFTKERVLLPKLSKRATKLIDVDVSPGPVMGLKIDFLPRDHDEWNLWCARRRKDDFGTNLA